MPPKSKDEEINVLYTAKDFDRALIAPEQVFSTPMDVVLTDSMTADQKLKVLKHWEINARDLQVASEEAMTGPQPSRLAEVRAAILKLCEQEKMDERSLC